jgi:hypothetical protein
MPLSHVMHVGSSRKDSFLVPRQAQEVKTAADEAAVHDSLHPTGFSVE